MTANPTDKPELPEDPKQITQYNLTLPITTTKELVQTAKMLRQNYFFHKIPATWIQMDEQINQTQASSNDIQTKPDIPQSLVELQEKLENIPDSIYINIPIQQQEDTANTLKILRQYFNFETIPDYLLQLPPLPEPTWDIFASFNID